MKKNERLLALNILTELIQNKTSLSASFSNAQTTPLVQKICYGVCRSFYQLEAIANQLVKKRPKSTEVWLCLLMGLYQIHALRSPDYAVVKETVSLLDEIKKTWAKGLVNGVLRNFCRQKDQLFQTIQHEKTYQQNHPSWLVQKYQKQWPDEWEDILEANDIHPPMTLRINQQKTSRTSYLKLLEDQKIKAHPTRHSSVGITLEAPAKVEDLPLFAKGYASVQDEAAQLAARLLNLKPGLRVLDACCAPGGKTGHILETESRLSSCVAVDIEPNRLLKVEDNLHRLELKAEVVTGNAATPDLWWDGTSFDRILLDAPCSATGVIRRHPDIKLLRTPEELRQVVEIQQQLLKNLWPLLAKNGMLLYATCSVMKEENEQQIEQFLSHHSDASVSKERQDFGNLQNLGWQILPGEDNMDGFFYSLLIKN